MEELNSAGQILVNQCDQQTRDALAQRNHMVTRPCSDETDEQFNTRLVDGMTRAREEQERREKLDQALPVLAQSLSKIRQALDTPFDIPALVARFQALHPTLDLKRCNIYVGDQHTEAVKQAVESQMTIQDIPVSVVPGAVGVMVMPPNYAAEQATKKEPK